MEMGGIIRRRGGTRTLNSLPRFIDCWETEGGPLRAAPTIAAVALVLLAACSLDPFAGRPEPQGGQVHTGLIGGPTSDAIGDGYADGVEEPGLRITALDPPRGNPAGGETITIEGGGFTQGCQVTFEGLPVRELYYVNTKTLMVVTPANPSGLAIFFVLLSG